MKNRKFTVLQIRKALLKTFSQMDEIRIKKTVLGKNNFTDVSQEDWNDSSFDILDIVKMTEDNLYAKS